MNAGSVIKARAELQLSSQGLLLEREGKNISIGRMR